MRWDALMGPTLAATAYGLTAIFAALFFRARVIKTPAILRAAVFWVLSVPILFLIAMPLLSLVTCGALLFALAPRERDLRLAYYVLAFPAVPAGIYSLIPFPGLNYLFLLDFPKVAFFVLLAGAFLTGARPPAAKFAPAIGIFVLALTLLFSVMIFREENLTNGLRGSVNYALLYALPYAGLIRLARDEDAVDKVFAGVVFLGCILFFTSLVSQATKWNFYDFLSARLGSPMFADFRGGVLRVGVTMVPALAGFLLGLGLLGVSYFRGQKSIGFATAWAYRALFAIAAYFTYSRGAWLAAAVGLAAYLFFTKAPRGLRPALMAFGAVVGLPAVIYFSLNADFGAVDAYGTFAYRQELVRATLVHVQQYPLFGDAHYYDRPHFAHLLQGQGIIDFVNRYVQIVVEYGIVGLFVFVAPWLVLLIGLLGLPGRDPSFWGSADERRRALLIAVVLSYLTLIATISAVSYITQFGIVILALGAAFLASVRARRAQSPAAAIAEGDLHRPEAAGAPA